MDTIAGPTALGAQRRLTAFTLVEVAISLGILAFCLVAIIGLIPVGLASFRESIDTGHQTRMIQTVRARLSDKPFSELPAEITFDFDENGADIQGINIPKRYEVKAIISTSNSLPGGAPGSVARVTLSIINCVTGISSMDHLHLSDNGF